ncbi:hypothetical protein K438DRAFT_1616341, partial [Mycena galopus ATCC 62051]
MRKTLHRCPGLPVKFPPGVSAWEGYTNGLHTELNDPWDAVIRRGEMRIFPHRCEENVDKADATCAHCAAIESSPHFQTVQHHILHPPKPGSHLVYYTTNRLIVKARKQQATVKALLLAHINDGNKIGSRIRALTTLHKQWVRA